MILDGLFEKRASLENPSTSLSDPANWLFEAFGANPTASAVSVTERNATQITAFYCAVATIADTLGGLPLRLMRKTGKEQTVVIDHPIWSKLKTSPNPVQTPVFHRSTQQNHALTWGNGYAWIKRDGLGRPLSMWNLLPQNVTPRVDDERLFFDTLMKSGERKPIPSDDIIHIPGLSRDGVVGMSVIREQREMLGGALATQNFGARFFANGGKAGGLVSFPGKVRDPEKIKRQIEQATGGDNAHALLVVGGGADYKPFSIPPDDAQFLQTKEFSVDEIGRMFRLPLHFLNKMGQATFNNLEQMGSHFVQYTMMPWLTRWEQELTRKLLTTEEIDQGMFFKFNVAALIRGDIKTRSEVYAKAISFGWKTRNEVRILEDDNPIDGLDEPLMPSNLIAVTDETDKEVGPAGGPGSEDPTNGDDPDDEPGDDGNDDDPNARGLRILTATVTRLIGNEANEMRRIHGKTMSDEWKADAIIKFYERQHRLMVDSLAFSEQDARQYCHARCAELAEMKPIDEVVERWQTEGVTELVEQIARDLT